MDDSIEFDISSPENQKAMKDFEDCKAQNWTVTDARRDLNNPNILLIDLKKPGF